MVELLNVTGGLLYRRRSGANVTECGDDSPQGKAEGRGTLAGIGSSWPFASTEPSDCALNR